MLASNKWLLLLLSLNLSTAFGGSDSTSSTYTYDFRDIFEFSGEWRTETSFDRWDFDSNQFIDARDLLVMLGGRRLAVPPTSIEMVDVPAGAFMMGRQDDGGGGGNAEELPAHSVTLSAYSIGKFEITNAQYVEWLNWALLEGILKAPDGSPFTGQSSVYAYGQRLFQPSRQVDYRNDRFSVAELDGYRSLSEHPVVRVSWYGAVLFCNWLSLNEGLTPCYDIDTWTLVDRFGGGYRLPTEAEWERAAAWDGEEHWIYAFESDDLGGKQRANYYDNNPAWVDPWGLSDPVKTSPVGWFNGRNVSPNGNVQTIDSPSPVGCYDMTGGVGEWCEDWFQEDFYSTEEAVQDDPICLNADSGQKVVRGGSWTEGPERCRTTFRPRSGPTVVIDRYGFRVVRNPVSPP